MSSISRWTYANTATVFPFEGEDMFNGGVTYGPPYTIACTWTAKSEQRRDAMGAEFVTRNIVWTEDKRPRYRDQIVLNGETARQDIRSIVNFDMSPFGQADSPDFELVT